MTGWLLFLAGLGGLMLSIGAIAGWLIGMTYPGMGGQQQPPQNASPAGQLVPGITPGVSQGVVLAHVVIVSGPSGAVVGMFVYAAGTTPGPGNGPLFWATNQAADPYGNAVTPTAGVAGTGQFNAGNTTINAAGTFTYSAAPAAGDLAVSSAPAAGTDASGNHYLQGEGAYGATIATNLAAGVVNFSNGSQAAGWTLRATIQTDAGGDLLLATTGAGTVQLASAAVAGSTLQVAGDCSMQSTAEVSGTLTVGNGTTSSLVFSPKIATPTNFPTAGKTLAQTQACLDALITSFQNRGMVN